MRVLGLGKDDESDKVRESQSLPLTTQTLSRLLFIGCGKVIGHRSVSWEDEEWPNAADFDAVFINGATLYHLLNLWAQARLDDSPISAEKYEGLIRNLATLKGEVLQIIDSQRSVFFFAVPDEQIVVSIKEMPRYTSNIMISPHDWNPIPIRIMEEKPGERLEVIDKRFADYAKQLNKWVLSFETAEISYNVRDAYRKRYYDLTQPKPLILNLSRRALAVELRYLEIEADRYDNPITIGTSGPIYLLHYPVSGDFWAALKAVVREFFAIELVDNSEPAWLETVDPPHGERIGARLEQINTELGRLFEEQAVLIEERIEFAKWRQLIYETGDALESILIEAFTVLGLEDAKRGPKGEWDFEGKIDGSVLIFEAKGVNGNPGRGDVHDLGRHIAEYDQRNPEVDMARGVLIGNSERTRPLSERNRTYEGFNGDAVRTAEKLDYALVNTWTLYQLVTEVIEGKRADAKDFLRELKNTVGVYRLEI